MDHRLSRSEADLPRDTIPKTGGTMWRRLYAGLNSWADSSGEDQKTGISSLPCSELGCSKKMHEFYLSGDDRMVFVL